MISQTLPSKSHFRDDALHTLIALLVTWARSVGFLSRQCRTHRLIETHHLPTHRFIAYTPTPNLPYAHRRISCCSDAYTVNFDHTGKAVISKLKANTVL